MATPPCWGEETLNPSRTIPISIGISLTIVFLSYFGVAAVITLVVPYCQQDEGAPLVALFDDENIGWVAAKWFVTVGALFGFSASLFGALFPLPRVLYAMASDGLLFRQLSQISKRFQTPTIATVIAGLSAGLMAMLFDLEALVSMMSIGTLMAYSIVALCVMLLRFKDEDGSDSQSLTESGLNQISTHQSSYSASDYLNQLFNQKGLKKPTDLSASIVSYAILLFCVMVLLLDIALVVLVGPLVDGEGGAVAGICILLALNILIVIIIARQPESKKKLSFKVPFVPWLPALSTMINTYLMCNLSPDTWVRFAVWMFIGFLIYFGYGIWHSSEGKRGTSKHGQNNLGFTGDGEEKDQKLVIPTIHVQPATPMSSQPNTPNLKAKAHETPIPPSPLATEETLTGQSEASDPKSTHEPDLDSEAAPLGAAAEVAHAGAASVAAHAGAAAAAAPASAAAVAAPVGAAAVVAPLGAVAVASSLMGGKKDSKESSSSRSEERGKEMVPADSDTSNENEVQSSQERKKCGEDSASGETPDSLPLIAGVSTLAAKVAQDDEQKDEEKTTEDSMKASSSAPDLPPSLPPQQPTISRVKSDGVLNRSVPTTPVVGRHPVKVLRRMSSFDDIPPSSPDSPLARHIGSKFVIIPVKEPGLDSNDSSSQVSPSFTPRVGKKDSSQGAAGSQEDMMKKVLYKLKDIPDGSQKEEEKSTKMFTVGSYESLDSISSETDANGLGMEQPGQKKLVNRESKLDMLDTIRERGESKIYSGDGDKTDIHTSLENSDKANIIDKIS